MSQCIVGKTSHNVGFSSMGYRLTGKTLTLQDASARYSNHMRCSFRLNSTMVKGSDSMAKFKALTTLPSTGLYIDHQNLLVAQVNQSLPHKRVTTERINGKVKTSVLKCTQKQLRTSDAQSTPRISRMNEFSLCLKDVNSATLQNLPEDGTGVLETCSAIVSKCTRKEIKHGNGSRSFYAPTISSTLRLIASRDAKEAIRSCSQDVGTGSKKCDLKNNSCSSISEVIPSGCSHFNFIPSIRDTLTSKIYLGESSTSIAKNRSASSNKKLSGSLSARLSTRTTLKASSTTNRSKINDVLTVVNPLEHSTRGTTRTPAKGNLYHPFREAMVAQGRKTKSLGGAWSSSRSFDNELSSTCHNVSGRKNFFRRDAPGRPTLSPALGSMLTLRHPTAITDFHSGNNTERSVEPPMMLERTERSQGQTFEHIIESNLPLRRLSHHDRHREMRMDIDNMSYEELLELVEKIGSVSTGLTDEALTKCLKQNKFKPGHFPFGSTDCFEDGNRCSICQEECADEEDIGELACEHWYHVFCITQWLKQKNWCPICKSPACANS